MAITCPLCPGLKFSSVKFFLKHLRLTHSDMPNFHIQCNLQGCKRTFRNLKYYQNHIFAHHDTSVLNGSQEVIEQMTTNENPHEESFQQHLMSIILLMIAFKRVSVQNQEEKFREQLPCGS